jgi:Calcineurin-like phosphoesterase superfamily domain
MKLGLLADIHEHTEQLQRAIALLQQHGAERFVVLGDVFEMGKQIEETVRLLQQVEAVGVWGNHDFGLCFNPVETVRHRFSTAVLDFMGTLRPRLEVEGCLFTHVEPWLDPHNVLDLWYFDGPPNTPEKLARSFAAFPHPIMFIGHMHRWLLGTPGGLLPWRGDRPMCLDSTNRYLVVIHAVCDGKCALFNTKTGDLVPLGEG